MDRPISARQVFRALADRDEGKTVEVVALRRRQDSGAWVHFALCKVLTDRAGARRSSVGRHCTILLARLHTDGTPRRSGWALVEP